MSREVKCINKKDRANRDEVIISIGGDWGKTSQRTAIKEIEDETQSYHVKVGNNDVKVIVAVLMGNKYLKTESDTLSMDNLLNLKESS